MRESYKPNPFFAYIIRKVKKILVKGVFYFEEKSMVDPVAVITRFITCGMLTESDQQSE